MLPEIYKLTKLIQEKAYKLNITISVKEIKFIVKKKTIQA